MRGLMDAMENWLRRAACIFAAIGGAVMLVMLALVTANMVSRPFGGTVRGTVEVSGYLCALGIGLCMPAAQMAGSHIAAGLWIASLPRPVQRIQGGAGNLLCAILLVFVGRELCDIAGYAFDLGEIIEGFGISHGGMAVGFACGIALHALMFLHAFLRTFFPVLPVRPAPAGRAQEGA